MVRRRPNWTALLTDLVASIGGLLIADDITDFIRFRAMCHPWRALSEETKRRADCQHPRSWIMHTNFKLSPAEPVELYNTSTHKSFSFDLKDYLEEYWLFRTSSCLILLQNKNTGGLALLNPFMRSLTQLPSKIESDCPKSPSRIENLLQHPFMEPLSNVYVTSSSIMVLCFSMADYLVWTKPGDESWVYDEVILTCRSNYLFYKDRILVVDPNKGIVQINFADGISSQSKVEVVIPDKSLDYARYLIDCNDKIFLVSFDTEDCEDQHFWESLEMYELDFDEVCVDVSEIGDHSIFLSDVKVISVSSKSGLIPGKAFTSVANTIMAKPCGSI